MFDRADEQENDPGLVVQAHEVLWRLGQRDDRDWRPLFVPTPAQQLKRRLKLQRIYGSSETWWSEHETQQQREHEEAKKARRQARSAA
jgi:hypothetical protein